MVQVALISDTHIPSRADRVPDWVRRRVQRADYTIHAGDFDSADALASVRELAGGKLTAVYGNMDPPTVDLPRVAATTIAGVTFVITHGTGSVHDYRDRVAETVQRQTADAMIGVCGHTHEPMDATVDGIRLLNPGSATGAAPAEAETMQTVRIEGGDVVVTTHES